MKRARMLRVVLAINAWLARPFLCKLALHFGRWHPQPNVHSQHILEVHRCERCPKTSVRVISTRRFRRRYSVQP